MSETYRTRNVKFKNNDLKLEDIYIQTPYIYLKYLPSTVENIETKYTLDLYLNIKNNVKKIKLNGKFQNIRRRRRL